MGREGLEKTAASASILRQAQLSLGKLREVRRRKEREDKDRERERTNENERAFEVHSSTSATRSAN